LRAWTFDILDHGARATAMALRAQKLALILGSRGPGTDLDTLVSVIAAREGPEFFAYATPFAVKNLERCFVATVKGEAAAAEFAEYLLLSLFDAFFDRLPDGFRCTVRIWGEEGGPLPRLGLHLYFRGELGLARLDRGRLGIHRGGETMVVDLGQPGAFGAPRTAIPGQAETWLLPMRAHALYGPEEREGVAPTDDDSAFAAEIGAALAIIDAVDPALGRRIAAMLKVYVPLAPPSEAFLAWYAPGATTGPEADISYSMPFLPGLAFLSRPKDPLYLAEVIVHEFLHNELFLVQETCFLFEGAPDRAFASPWRSDPRTYNGLLHGLHVFTGIADFLAEAAASPACAGRALPRDLGLLHAQIAAGLAALDRGCLTDVGQHLMAFLEGGVRTA